MTPLGMVLLTVRIPVHTYKNSTAGLGPLTRNHITKSSNIQCLFFDACRQLCYTAVYHERKQGRSEREHRMKRGKRIILDIIIVALLCVMGYSGYRIFTQMMEYHKNEVEYKGLRDYTDHSGEEEDFAPHTEEPGIWWNVSFPDVDFEGLLKKNPDTIGWIYCPETHIDYPVVQGKNNDEYLHKSFEGIHNVAGSIFLDAENKADLSDFNSILYGHHMKNGSMFRDLDHYKEEGYYEEHPYMLFMTPKKNYVVELFAGYVSSVKEDSWDVVFPTVEDRQKWIDKRLENSAFKGIVVPDVNSHILTLSTCSYEFSNARFVLYGILTEVPKKNKK